MIELSRIKQIHLELTTRCQARCPMCPRNYRGTDYNSGYPITELTTDQVASILAPIIGRLDNIFINGNLGDFGLASQGAEIAKWLLENSRAKININTNGSNRKPDWWAQLAHPRLTVTFGIDGMADTHSLYRLQTDWHKIMENAKAYILAGGRARWQLIPFLHNQHQIEQCRELSSTMGFEDFVLCDQGRDQGPVYDRQGEFSHWLGNREPSVPPLSAMLESHVTWYRPETVKNIGSANIQCHAKRSQEIYIAADGSVYPCCYLGFYPQSMQHPGNDQIKQMSANNNALEHGLEKAIEWFNQVEQSWSQSTVGQGQLYTCAVTCGGAR